MSNYLVCYFSPTGTTRTAGGQIAEAIGADQWEIRPRKPYSEKDLDWRRRFARCSREHRYVRFPAIEDPMPVIGEYGTVFLGFPIWYETVPNAVLSFLKKCDWSRQRIILFATSGGSGIGKAEEDIREYLKHLKVKVSIEAASIVKPENADENKIWASTLVGSFNREMREGAERYIQLFYKEPVQEENAVREENAQERDPQKTHFSRAAADEHKASYSLSGSGRFSRDFFDEDAQSELERLRKENEILIRRQQEINRRLGYTAVRSPLDRYNQGGVQRAMNRTNAQASSADILHALDSYTDQSFVGKLMSLIRQKGLKEPDVYRAAQIDRRLFSRIISDQDYKPAKDTCIALAYALKLNLNEATDFLSRAGYTFSHSNKRDVILEYFFNAGKYDLFDINEVLSQLNQRPLGRQS